MSNQHEECGHYSHAWLVPQSGSIVVECRARLTIARVPVAAALQCRRSEESSSLSPVRQGHSIRARESGSRFPGEAGCRRGRDQGRNELRLGAIPGVARHDLPPAYATGRKPIVRRTRRWAFTPAGVSARISSRPSSRSSDQVPDAAARGCCWPPFSAGSAGLGGPEAEIPIDPLRGVAAVFGLQVHADCARPPG